MEDLAIKFDEVGKKFKKGRTLLLKEALIDVFKPASTEEFWALKNVSFEVKKGRSIGIIGSNGSGKSTILKLIAQVMVPNKGKVTVSGQIAPLIELGAGFHPELTGRENIYLNGTILGMSREEIDEKFSKIVDFAELKDFIDTPIKHFSSGMYMRLGFAVAVHVNLDILLIDEVLSVGDFDFQNKCIKKMESFKKEGKTVVFVSHSLETVSDFCDEVIYLKDGQVYFKGDTQKAIQLYRQ